MLTNNVTLGRNLIVATSEKKTFSQSGDLVKHKRNHIVRTYTVATSVRKGLANPGTWLYKNEPTMVGNFTV